MRRFRHRSPKVLYATVFIAFALIASSAAAQNIPPAAAKAGPQSLLLEVWINASATNLIGAFNITPDGALSAQALELRSLGLKVPDSGEIPLKSLPGVLAHYDEINQRLYITAEDKALIPHKISVRPRPVQAELTKQAYGAVLNYELFAQVGEALQHNGAQYDRLSGDYEVRGFGPFGVVDDTFTAETGTGEKSKMIRLETSWTWTHPDQLVTERAGDLITGGFDWTQPIRMAGIQIRRDFSLRPDLITMPTPSIDGSTAVPSTLEVFTNHQSVAVSGVAPGPFRLDDLPIVDGYSQTQLILRDASGIERTITTQFYATPQLVCTGLLDYSAEIGLARRNYGQSSADYDLDPVGSGSVRYGVNDFLTVQGHAEGGAGVAESGAGAVVRVGSLGVTSLAVAGSDWGGQIGEEVRVGFQSQYRGVFLGGSYQITHGVYADIASATSPPIFIDNSWKSVAAPPRQLAQLSLSAPLTFAGFSRNASPIVSVAYAGRVDAFGRREDTMSLGVREAFSRFTVYATAYSSFSAGQSGGFFVGMSMPLSSRTTFSAGGQDSGSGASVFVEESHQVQPQPGSFGWYLHADGGDQNDLQANATYLTRQGRLESDLAIRPQDIEAQTSFAGSLIFMDHSFFAAPWVQNAFAVVDAGEPGVAIHFQNRFIGVTNAQGRLLAPDLNAYEPNTIEIDPTNLPIYAEIGSTRAVATPAYDSGVLVHFDLKSAPPSALVVLKVAEGGVLAAGSQAVLDSDGEVVIVGYDGQVFLTNLQPLNRLIVTLPDGSNCVANFAYHADPQDIGHVLEATCR